MQRDSHETEIADTLAAIGIDPTSVATRSDSREPVYEVRSSTGRYYAKRLKDEKGRAMREVIEQELAVGLPDSKLIRNDAYVLVMDPAAGMPLSLSLPCCLLPVVWEATSGPLSRAAREIGRYLGELHSGTRTGDRRAGDDECRIADRLTLDRSLREYVSDRTEREVGRLFDELRETRLPFASIHGDPTPHNIFWKLRTGDVDIIDFNLHGSVAVEDLVVFESGIELMAGRLPYARRSQAATLIDAFRSGYLERGVHDSIPARTVAIAKLSYYAHLLSRFLCGETSDTRREKLTRYTDRRIVEGKIESLASRL